MVEVQPPSRRVTLSDQSWLYDRKAALLSNSHCKFNVFYDLDESLRERWRVRSKLALTIETAACPHVRRFTSRLSMSVPPPPVFTIGRTLPSLSVERSSPCEHQYEPNDQDDPTTGKSPQFVTHPAESHRFEVGVSSRGGTRTRKELRTYMRENDAVRIL